MHSVSVGCALQRDKELFSWMGGVLSGAMRMQSDLLQDYFVFSCEFCIYMVLGRYLHHGKVYLWNSYLQDNSLYGHPLQDSR